LATNNASQTTTERVQIAELWRMQSKMQNSNKPENIMDVTPEAVTQVMAEQNVSTLYYMVIRIAL
jgi:UDP-2,3-diacylglucosamine hydrolase